MVPVGLPVLYTPHAEHDHLSEYTEAGLAATVGRVNPDGTASLFVMQPNKEPHWQDNVPEGTGPHTFAPIGSPRPAETASNVIDLNAGTSAATGEQTPPTQG